MLFVHRAPAPPLDTFIASIWFCENEPKPFSLERVLPSGAAQLIVNLKAAKQIGLTIPPNILARADRVIR